MLKSYNLRENPFSTNPLTLDNTELLDKCFKGREKSFELLTNQLELGNAMIIGIRSGIGKTSFINYALYKLKDRYFYAILNTEENWNEESLLRSILSAIFNSLDEKTDRKMILKKLIGNAPSIVSLVLLEMFHLKDIKDEVKGIIDFDKKTYDPIQDLKKAIKTTIKELYDLSNGKETIIAFDDLDNMTMTNMKKVFRSLKDVFQTEHSHYVFIGKPWTYNALDGIMHDFINRPINLEQDQLTLDDVIESVEKRMMFMRDEEKKEAKVIPPYKDKNVLKKLYDIYEGNMRGILNGLASAVSFKNLNNTEPVQLSENEIVDKIRNGIKEDIEELENGEKLVLKKLADTKGGTLSLVDISNKKPYQNKTNVSKYLNGRLGPYVYISRITGKDIFWSLRPEIKYFVKLDKTFLD